MNEKTIQAEWQLLNKGLYVSFLRMSPGKEQAFLDEISERKGYKKGPILYYKCLGYYDLVELHEISDLNDAFIYKTHRDLLEIVSIPCFSWSEEKYSKAIFSWVGDKPLLFLMLLKIDEAIYEEFQEEGELKIIEKLSSLSSDLSVHIGIGYNELIAFYKTDNLNDIYDLIERIRSMHIGDGIPAFVDTVTFPLVSYDNVIRSSNFEKIKGNVKAVTKISCHPCMEHDIFNDLTEIGKKDAKVYDLLGERDLEVEWPPDVPGCYVIQHLLEFRKRWSEKSGLYSTQTLLQEHKTTGFTECHARKPFQTFIQISLEDIQKMQERLGYENFNILFVLNYVQDYLTKWNSISSSPNYSAAFYDMLYFNYSLEARITQYFELLTEFVELQKKDADSAELFRLKSATTTLEGYIIRLIEIANIGFGQRFVGLEASSSIGVSLLSGMFGGLNRVANAAALIPEYLYQSAQDKDCAYPWLGYIFFKQIYGYEIISEGEVISMPESAILYPLFAGTSWLTLTHEVAHGFFFRLGLHKNDTLEGLKNKISELLLARIKSQKGESEDLDLEKLNVDYDVWELFAHWFDYKFTYEGDIEFYLNSIWASWAQVPRVYQKFTDYIKRSILLCISHQYESYIDAFRKGKKDEFLINTVEYILILLDRISLGFPIPSIDVGEKEMLLKDVSRLAYFIGFFEENLNLSPDFLRMEMTDTVRKQIDQILNGHVIFEKIKNPVLVLQGLLKALKKNPTASRDIMVNISLICSFSNSSRVLLRKKVIDRNDDVIRDKLKSMK